MTIKQKYSSSAGKNAVTGSETRTYTVYNADAPRGETRATLAKMSGHGTFLHTYTNVCGSQKDSWDWNAAGVKTSFAVVVTNDGIALSAGPVMALYVWKVSGLQGPANDTTQCPTPRPKPEDVKSQTGVFSFSGGGKQRSLLHTEGSKTGSAITVGGGGSLGVTAGTTATVTWNLTRGIAKVRGIVPPPPFCNKTAQFFSGAVGEASGLVSFLTSATVGLEGLSAGAGVGGTVIGVVGLGCTLASPPGNSGTFAESACGGLATASVGLGVGAVVTSPTVVGGILLGGAGILTGAAAAIACAADPPDPTFRTVATPAFSPVKGVARAGVNAQQATVLTAIANSVLEMRAVATAMTLCINRASGAAQAKNALWESRQRECAAKNARRLAGLYRAQVPLRKRIVDELRKAAVPNATVSRAAANAALLNPSASARQGLKKLGISAAALKFAQSQVGNVKGKRPATIYDAIDGRNTIAALNAGAKAFDQIAKKYS